MSIEFIPFEAGSLLDWRALTDALIAGHTHPRAEIGDTFLYRGNDTLLSRAAWIDGMGIAVKTASIFPGNRAQGRPMINGAVNLYDDADGTLDAVVDFHLILSDCLPQTAVLAVLHGEFAPTDPYGAPFYSALLDIQDGVGHLHRVEMPDYDSLRHAAE